MAGEDDDEFEYDESWPSQKAQGLRKNFMDSDDKRIIKYLLKTKDVVYLKGYEVWKRMQHSCKYNPRGFSYHSLHERWRRIISPSIHRYGLTDSEKEMLLCKPPGYFATQRKIAKGKQNRRAAEGKSLLDQFDDSSEMEDVDVAGPSRANTLEIDDSDSVSSLEIRRADSQDRKNAQPKQKTSASEEAEVEKTPPRAQQSGSDETRRSARSRHVTFSDPLARTGKGESSKEASNKVKRRALFVEESPVIEGSIRDADGPFTPRRVVRNHNQLKKAETSSGTRGSQTVLSLAKTDDPSYSDHRDSTSSSSSNSSSDDSYLLEELSPRTSSRIAKTGISTRRRTPASQTLLREAVTDSLPMDLPGETTESSDRSDEDDDSDERSPSKRSRKRSAPSTPSTSTNETTLRRRSGEPSPSVTSPQQKGGGEKDETENMDSSEQIRTTAKAAEKSSAISRRSSQEESPPDEREENDDTRDNDSPPPRRRSRDATPSNLTAANRTLRKRPSSPEQEKPAKKLCDGDAPDDTLRIALRKCAPGRSGITENDGEDEEPENQPGTSQADGSRLVIDTTAESQESPVKNLTKPTMSSLRKFSVVISWDECERTKQALKEINSEVEDENLLNSAPCGDRVPSPSTPRQAQAPTTVKKSPPSSARSLRSGFTGARPKGTTTPTRSTSSRTNSKTNSESPNVYYLGTNINCVSSSNAMLEVSLTSRFRVPLPRVLQSWTTALRLLRESAESMLRQHDAADLEAHAACSGLGEYLDLWLHLRILIERANEAENDTVLRKWRESRVVTLISEILSMPVCRSADTNSVTVPLQQLGDQAVVCSQLRTPEWKVFMDVMASIRDTATSKCGRAQQQK